MNPVVALANRAVRSLIEMFPGYFHGAKHNHYADFGFPGEISFEMALAMYQRNGLARAAVDKTVAKTWQDTPWLQEFHRDAGGERQEETKLEAGIRQKFSDLNLWQHLAECDRRGLVGAYSGAVLRFADGKRFQEPVTRLPGLDGLVEIIPAWEGQLTVIEWDTVETSETYGQPKTWQFNEAAVGQKGGKARQVTIHPDRVLVWSRDGTVHGQSALNPGYNDLLTLEKVVGAGGEGFWKNAKAAPILEVDKDANIQNLAKLMGVAVEDVADKMDEAVRDFNRGLDQTLMMQGITANTLSVNLPSPEHFFLVALQCFAASFSIPLKILVGSQTGERASTEDASEWARTVMGRRHDLALPNLRKLVTRLERFGVLPERDWHLEWTDLTASTIGEKIDRVAKMATINQSMKDTGEWVFTPEEMRAAADYEPLKDADKYRDDKSEGDERRALGLDDEDEPEAKAA